MDIAVDQVLPLARADRDAERNRRERSRRGTERNAAIGHRRGDDGAQDAAERRKPRERRAARRLDDRALPGEFRAGLGVVQAPVPADRAFVGNLPRLVEGLDHVEVEPSPRREHGELAQVPRLLQTAGLGRSARPARAWPARLTDEQRLAGKFALQLRVQPVHVRDDVIDPHRVVVPVRQDVHRDEVDVAGQRLVVDPAAPDVGVGDRHVRRRGDAPDQHRELRSGQFVSQQHFVTDDDAADRVALLAYERDAALDFTRVRVGVATDPQADEHLHPELARHGRNMIVAFGDRVGPDAARTLGQQREVVPDLRDAQGAAFGTFVPGWRVRNAGQARGDAVRQVDRLRLGPPVPRERGATDREQARDRGGASVREWNAVGGAQGLAWPFGGGEEEVLPIG